MVRISLAWRQDGIWEIVMVNRIRPVLRLQTEAPVLVVCLPCRTSNFGEKITSIKLDSYIIRKHLHYPATCSMPNSCYLLHF